MTPDRQGQSVTVTLTLDDADSLAVTVTGIAPMLGRADLFETHDRDDPDAAPVLGDPAYAGGSLRWTDTRLEALLLTKVLRARGYAAEQLYAVPTGSPLPSAYLVITSLPVE